MNITTTINQKFFRKEKCDLSDKANEEDEKKKARENSLNSALSKEDTHFFEERIESPRCAGILYSCWQNVGKKVNNIDLSSSAK